MKNKKRPTFLQFVIFLPFLITKQKEKQAINLHTDISVTFFTKEAGLIKGTTTECRTFAAAKKWLGDTNPHLINILRYEKD